MKNQEITICVTPEAARVYQSASAQDRRKLDVLLSLQLSGLRKPARPIEDIMREASEEARKNGLTPEILVELLNEI
ncbi:MAG: hypothetical protein OXH06_10725 [Gemmatimonadetes bacterium]|nr:hypothetical protein [Gemmatimonadota bacterium]